MATSNVGEYLRLRIEEATARLRAVNQIVSHSTSKGDVGEEILQDIVEQFLPKNFEVSSGFAVAPGDGYFVQSRQVDVLVYDRSTSVPLYQDRGLVVVSAEMVRLVVESKLFMNKSQLEESITNIQSIKKFNREVTAAIWAYQGMTIDTLKKHLAELLQTVPYEEWPDQIFNLQRNYVVNRPEHRPEEHVWEAHYGKNFLARSFFQAVLSAGDVENLFPFLSGVMPDRSEVF